MATNELKAAVKMALDELNSGPIIRAELEKICEKTLSSIESASTKMETIVKRLKKAKVTGGERLRHTTPESFWIAQEKGLASTIPVKNDR